MFPNLKLLKKICYPGQQKLCYPRQQKFCYPGQQKFKITLLSRIAKLCYPGQQNFAIHDSKTIVYPGQQTFDYPGQQIQLSRIVKVLGQEDIQLSRVAKDRKNIKLSRILKDSKTFSYPGQQDIKLSRRAHFFCSPSQQDIQLSRKAKDSEKYLIILKHFDSKNPQLSRIARHLATQDSKTLSYPG